MQIKIENVTRCSSRNCLVCGVSFSDTTPGPHERTAQETPRPVQQH